MNMKSNVKRYLAALLTVIMIFQQSGANAIFASSENIPAATTTEEEVAAQSEEPEEEEPEAEEPEEEEPEQTPEEQPDEDQQEDSDDSNDSNDSENLQNPVTPVPEVTEVPTETPTPEVTEVPTETPTPEVTETPEETPKTDFTYEDSRVAITAKAEEGANLPQDAELRVEYLQDTDPEKYNTELNELNNLLGVDNEKIIADYLFYDIYFTSESAGGRIEPAAGTVKVQMQYATPQLEKNTDDESCQSTLKVYVNRKEDTTAEFEKNETDAVKSVKFKTSEMGVVALTRVNEVTETKKNEQVLYTYEDSDIAVNATLSSPDAVPDGAEFRVTKVTPDTAGYNYEAYMQALNNSDTSSSDDTAKYTEKNTLLYDVAFLVEKTDEEGNVIPGEMKEYQPEEGTVNISFEFKKKQLSEELNAEDTKDISIIHLPLDNEIKESVDTTADATAISADNVTVENVEGAAVSNNSVDFELSNFSVVAVTVNNGKLNIQPGTDMNFQDILGKAVYYGIVANTIRKQAHMDSNFATKTLYINGKENVTTGAYTANGGVYVVASVNGSGVLAMDGKNNILWCTADDRDRFDVTGTVELYPSATLEAYVNSLIQNVTSKATAMAGYQSYDVNSIVIDGQSFQNKREIDITDCEDGTYYFDMTPYAGGIDELKVRKNPGQNVVFNYPNSTTVTLKRFTLFNGKNDTQGVSSATSNSTVDSLCRSIIFNMPNATNVNFASATAGLFLAPKATISLGGTSSGWIVADDFQNGGGEWHCVYGDLPTPDSIEKPTSETFSVSKTVDGKMPTTNEKFLFTLEQIGDVPEGSTRLTAKEVENNGSHVNFGTITYDKEGTYYYKISEKGKATGTEGEYTCDNQSYIVKVVVTADTSTSGNLTTKEYVKQTTYYKGNSVDDCVDKNKVTTGDGITFKNEKSAPTTTEVTVTKDWKDENNQDGIRPDSVKVQLCADGKKCGDEVTLTSAANWTYTWSSLPEKASGKKITYTVQETEVPEGYTSEVTGDDKTGYTVTNIHAPETTQIEGTKTWSDGGNQDGTRPSSITVNLLANGEKKASQEVTADNGWKYTFTNLPKYAAGSKIVYTVSEEKVDGYTATVSGYDITNTYKPGETSITVTKSWKDGNNQDGIRPDSVKVQLCADGKKCGDEVTLTSAANWTYTWSSLPEKASGKKITYTVQETEVPEGYTSEVTGDDKTGYTVTNIHAPETTQIEGTKTWSDGGNQDGTRPSSITVNLLANGTKKDSKTVTAKDDWKYSFTNLPKYENGKEITYTVTEDAVPGYSTKIDGYNITNSYTPGKTSVTVTKKWVDNDNKSGKRPSEIKVQLYADGKESGSPVTLNEANKWTYTWSGLDEKNGGTTIVYTVKEVGTVDGYETSVSGDARTGFTITNTLKSGTLEIVKAITGAVSESTLTAEQKAAMTFTVTGPDGYSETVHYSDFTDGKYTFSNLPLGEYTVTETNADIEGYKLTTTYSVDGGKATVTSKETATVTITNNYTTNKKTSVKISKVDAETYKVLGGAHLMVIDPDGNVVDEWDSTKNAHKITGLKPGVTYTLRETKAPKGYDVAADTTFELNEDGTINTANTTTSISGDALLVKDEKTADKTVSVSVTKRLVTVDGQVIGAPDATYYVALYSDPDCTQRVSDVMALNYKNASVSTVTFTGLKKGQTYYVGECEADGTSYLANVNADGTLYTVDFSDGNTVEVTNNDGSKTIYFDNQFERVPDGYYKEGELNITKKLVGGDGKAKNSSEIFYAGIFSDADFTQLSPDVSDNIVPLDLAGGSEVTSQVKVSIPESGSITLYVTEVDSKGNPVAGAASFKYDVSVDNMQVTFDDDNISADVVITNSENTPEVTPTPTTTTPNTPVTQSGSTTKSAVKTGDSTPIGMFVGLFAAAAVIAGAAVFFKRRKK